MVVLPIEMHYLAHFLRICQVTLEGGPFEYNRVFGKGSFMKIVRSIRVQHTLDIQHKRLVLMILCDFSFWLYILRWVLGSVGYVYLF
jgi:hypothetical protein